MSQEDQTQPEFKNTINVELNVPNDQLGALVTRVLRAWMERQIVNYLRAAHPACLKQLSCYVDDDGITAAMTHSTETDAIHLDETNEIKRQLAQIELADFVEVTEPQSNSQVGHTVHIAVNAPRDQLTQATAHALAALLSGVLTKHRIPYSIVSSWRERDRTHIALITIKVNHGGTVAEWIKDQLEQVGLGHRYARVKLS